MKNEILKLFINQWSGIGAFAYTEEEAKTFVNDYADEYLPEDENYVIEFEEKVLEVCSDVLIYSFSDGGSVEIVDQVIVPENEPDLKLYTHEDASAVLVANSLERAIEILDSYEKYGGGDFLCDRKELKPHEISEGLILKTRYTVRKRYIAFENVYIY